MSPLRAKDGAHNRPRARCVYRHTAPGRRSGYRLWTAYKNEPGTPRSVTSATRTARRPPTPGPPQNTRTSAHARGAPGTLRLVRQPPAVQHTEPADARHRRYARTAHRPRSVRLDRRARAVRERAGLVRALRPRRRRVPAAGSGGQRLPRPHPPPRGDRGRSGSRTRAGAPAPPARGWSPAPPTLHAELEAELADFCGFEAALVLSSGYAANLAALTALTDRGTLLVSDAGNHASLIDGCRLSRAETAVVPHADPDAVRKALDGHSGPRARR